MMIAAALAGCQRAEDPADPEPATMDERRALEDAAEMIGTRPVASPPPEVTEG